MNGRNKRGDYYLFLEYIKQFDEDTPVDFILGHFLSLTEEEKDQLWLTIILGE